MITVVDKKFENLTFSQACFSKNSFWAQGTSIPGLWKIDRTTWQADRISDLLGMDWMISIINYENYIIMIPIDLSYDWVIYDQFQKELKYRKVFDGIQTYCADTFLLENELWLIPRFLNQKIIIVNIQDFSYRFLDNWAAGMSSDALEINGFRCARRENSFFLPIKGTARIAELDVCRETVVWHELPINNAIQSISCIGDSLWILPDGGEDIYLLDVDWQNIRKIDGSMHDFSEYMRIVGLEEGCMLLPREDNPIFVYSDKDWKQVDFPAGFDWFGKNCFWDYYKENDIISLFPQSSNMLLEIDVRSLKTIGRKIRMTVDWTEEEKKIEIEKGKFRFHKDLYYDKEPYSLNAFLRFVTE